MYAFICFYMILSKAFYSMVAGLQVYSSPSQTGKAFYRRCNFQLFKFIRKTICLQCMIYCIDNLLLVFLIVDLFV